MQILEEPAPSQRCPSKNPSPPWDAGEEHFGVAHDLWDVSGRNQSWERDGLRYFEEVQVQENRGVRR